MTLYWDGQITSSIQVKKYTIDAIAKALEASSDGTANFVTVCLEVSNGSVSVRLKLYLPNLLV